MAENNVAEEPLEGHGAAEHGMEVSLSGFSESPVANLAEQTNGVSEIPFEFTTRTHQDDGTVGTFPENTHEPTNQVDHDDAKSNDTARDDMFVDCPDELVNIDGRHTDIKEETDAGESRKNMEEDRQSHFGILENGAGDESAVKDEQGTVAEGVFDIYCQLKALAWQQSLPDEAEAESRDKEAQLADIPLNEIIKECLEFVKTTKEERSNAEATIRSLQALIYDKDHQIENLNTKVTELFHDSSAQRVPEVSSEVVDRIMSSLATVVSQEQLVDNTISGKIVHIEEGTALLTAKYNNVLSEIYQLGQAFSEVGLDARDEDHGNTLAVARGGLLELKRKEAELVERLAYLEDENRKLLDELDEERVMIGTLNAEVGNMKEELEQEKVKSTNTKEKLTMAVMKGKALVQQRDSLKKSLADKSSEHEKCLIELQEKSAELEAVRFTKDALVQSENLVASLQNSLLQSNTIIEQVEKILSQAVPDTPKLGMLERLSWLVDDRDSLKGSFIELCKLKDAISIINLPESVSSFDLESKINWLGNSYYRATHDTNILREEILKVKEGAHNCVDFLSASFLLESLEKGYLQSELTDLRCEYEEIIEMNLRVLKEKEQIVKMVIELSGYNMGDEGIDSSSPDTFMIINHCFQMIKEQSGHFSGLSHFDTDLNETIQSQLYVRDQKLMLCEDILEEEMVIRSEVSKLANDLKTASDEIHMLKEEKSSLQKDLDRSEDKSAILKDKLSMAVKKGKGLVQERDNLKNIINEKNLEIEQLKLDVQKQESVVFEYSGQINKLSGDLESVPKLEAELQVVKGERNELEQLLLQINNLLQRVVESIDHIHLPVDSAFEEPLEKVKWLAGFVSECQDAKLHAEQELLLVKEKANDIESKLAEAQATVESLRQALSSAENNFSQSAEEKRELELGKAEVEEELHKVKEEHAILSSEKELAQTGRAATETELEQVKEEAARLTNELAQARATIKDLEEVGESIMSLRAALSQAEKDISVLTNEKDLAQTGRAAAETELEQVREEAVRLTIQLAEASATIKGLEEVGESTMSLRAALSQAEKDIAVLTNEKDMAQTGRASVETELEQVKEAAARLTSELAEARATIKDLEEVGESIMSLRNALSQAEKDNSVLTNEKDMAQTGRAAAETELEQVKEAAARLTTQLAEARATIKDFEEVGESVMSLRDALSQAEKDISVLTNEKDMAQIGRAAAETELEQVKEAAARLTTQLAEASANIKVFEEVGESTISLRAALSQAERDIDVHSNEKELALTARAAAEAELERVKEEASSLTSKLEEASTTIKDLQEATESTLSLRNALSQAEKDISVVSNEKELAQTGRVAAEAELERVKEEVTMLTIKLAEASTTIKGLEEIGESAVSLRDALSQAEKDIAVLSHEKELALTSRAATEVELERVKEEASSLASNLSEVNATLKNLEEVGEAALSLRAALSQAEKDIAVLSNEKEKDQTVRDALETELERVNEEAASLTSKLAEAITTIKDLEDLLSQANGNFNVLKDKYDVDQVAKSKMESELKKLQDEAEDSASQLIEASATIKTLEDTLLKAQHNISVLEDANKTAKEEISSLNFKLNSCLDELSGKNGSLENRPTKQEEAENSLLSESQVRTLFGKIDRINVPFLELAEDVELNTSAPVNKLFNIIDSVIELRYQMNSLSHDKEELQTTIATKDLEIKHLEEEVKQLNSKSKDLEKVKNELPGLTFALEKILSMLGASDWVEDKKSMGLNELMPLLEKQVTAIILESESAKSKATELGGKLVGSQKLIDELTNKVRLLESSQDKTSQTEAVQEKSLFETPSLPGGSEISEVEEGSLGKKGIPAAPSAALVLNMRKGSADHLAVDIDGESDRLISRADVDEDKGHVFKSLNTSGFVPKQGKLIADRIDGIWVSGGRLLMSRPRARLGVICYSLLLHIWLLATIL